MLSDPLVSVVIPTKNSEEFLKECLINICECKQAYPNIEIVIVDNFSTDKTPEIAKQFTDKFYQIGPERTSQANFGIKRAKGKIIYLTGSDMTRDWYFIKEGVEKIKQGYDAVYTSVLTDRRVKHFWGKVKALERKSYINTWIESARFFTKDVYTKLSGFDEELIGLEEDFQHILDRYGFSTGRISAREYHLHEDDSLKKIFRKAFYYGSYSRKYLFKHKKRAIRQMNPLRPNLKLFIYRPNLLLGLVIYKCVQYFAGGLGLILGRFNE